MEWHKKYEDNWKITYQIQNKRLIYKETIQNVFEFLSPMSSRFFSYASTIGELIIQFDDSTAFL